MHLIIRSHFHHCFSCRVVWSGVCSYRKMALLEEFKREVLGTSL